MRMHKIDKEFKKKTYYQTENYKEQIGSIKTR
jgi:hypothetical protein